MYVEASANEGEKIAYQWAKRDSEEENWVDLEGASAASYKIPQITKDTLGEYRCTVSTSGEEYSYEYIVKTMYDQSQSRDYAEQGDSFTLQTSIVNQAKDAEYTYVWYAENPVTGSMKKTDCTQAEYRSEALAVKIDGSVEGFIPVDYSCQIFCDGKPVTEDEYSGNDTCTYEIKVLPKVTYSTSVLPETSHPFDKRVDIQAYRVEKAENIKITLDEQSENVLVIDAFGHGSYMPAITDGKNDYVQTLSGNSAIFLATDGDGVGY